MLGLYGTARKILRDMGVCPEKFIPESERTPINPDPIEPDEPTVDPVNCEVYFCTPYGNLTKLDMFGVVDANTFVPDLHYNVLLLNGDIYYSPSESTRFDKISTGKYAKLSTNYTVWGQSDHLFAIKADGSLWDIFMGSSDSSDRAETQIGTDTDWEMITGTFQDYGDYMYEPTFNGAYAIKNGALVELRYQNSSFMTTVINSAETFIHVFGRGTGNTYGATAIAVTASGKIYSVWHQIECEYDEETWEQTITKDQAVVTQIGTVDPSDIAGFHERIVITKNNELILCKDDTTIKTAAHSCGWKQFSDFGDTDGGYYAIDEDGVLYRFRWNGSLSQWDTNVCGMSGVYEYYLHGTMYVKDNDLYIGGDNNGNGQPAPSKKTSSEDFMGAWGGSWMYPTIVLKKVTE